MTFKIKMIIEIMPLSCDNVSMLIGNSLGGWIALKFAAAYPGRTGKLVLTGAMPPLTDNEMRKLTMPLLYIAGENDVTTDVGKAAKSSFPAPSSGLSGTTVA